MNKSKKKTKRILSHALEIISILTGEVSLLQHLSSSLVMIEMNKDKKLAERILNHALEIIYLVTGENYTIVKKNSPHSSLPHLTGEREDAAVSLFMEVWEQTEGNKDLGAEAHQGLSTVNIQSHHSPDPALQEEEDEIDEKDILQMTINSELCAGPSIMKSSILPKPEQEEEELNLSVHQQVKEEDIPMNISDGLHDEYLHSISINEKGEYEREKGDIHPMEIHPDICAEQCHSLKRDSRGERETKREQSAIFKSERTTRDPQFLPPTSREKTMTERKKDQGKLKRQSISLNVKIQVLDRFEKGERQVDIGADLKLPTSTIRTILKNKEKIRSSATTSTASSAKKITRSRCYALEEMEKQLSVWIDDAREHNVTLSQAIIMEKARSIYGHIRSQTPDVTESFSASRGWFDRFKKRNNLNITGRAVTQKLRPFQPFV